MNGEPNGETRLVAGGRAGLRSPVHASHFLPPPGASVLARTPAGLAPLTKIELAASIYSEGPLLYGIYTTPPTEIVVENADGTILYTENLAHKATEETEFCEGYTEH